MLPPNNFASIQTSWMIILGKNQHSLCLEYTKSDCSHADRGEQPRELGLMVTRLTLHLGSVYSSKFYLIPRPMYYGL